MAPKREAVLTGAEPRHVPDKGLGLVSTRELPLGTVILQERPYATALLPHAQPEVCRNCLAPVQATTKGRQTCQGCHSAHYCSYRCSSLDRNSHRESGECWLFSQHAELRRLAPEGLRREAILALRHLHVWPQPAPATGPSAEQPPLTPADAPLSCREELLAAGSPLDAELAAWQGSAQTAGPGEGQTVPAELAARAEEGAQFGLGPGLTRLCELLVRAALAGQAARRARELSDQRRQQRREQRRRAKEAQKAEAANGSRPADAPSRSSRSSSSSSSSSSSDDSSDDEASAPAPQLSAAAGAPVDAGAVAMAARAIATAVVNALEVALYPPFAAGLVGAGRQAVAAAAEHAGTPLALYRAACRINHSCRPSAAYHFRPGGQLLARLTADLAEGQEVTLAYVDLAWPRFRRRRQLGDKYGFACACARCTGGAVGGEAGAAGEHAAAGPLSAADALLLGVRDGAAAGAAVVEVAMEREEEEEEEPGQEAEAAESDGACLPVRLQRLVRACGTRLLGERGGAGEAYAALVSGMNRLEAVAEVEAGAGAGGLLPQQAACLDAYTLLGSAARRCARAAAVRAASSGVEAASSGGGGGGDGGVLAWWCRAACASLAGAAAAERLLEEEPAMLQHAASAWSDAASTLCELLAALAGRSPASAAADAPAASAVAVEAAVLAAMVGERTRIQGIARGMLRANGAGAGASGRGEEGPASKRQRLEEQGRSQEAHGSWSDVKAKRHSDRERDVVDGVWKRERSPELACQGPTQRNFTPPPCTVSACVRLFDACACRAANGESDAPVCSTAVRAVEEWRQRSLTESEPALAAEGAEQGLPALAAHAAVALASAIARLQLLLRLLLGEAHAACEAASFLSFFPSCYLPYRSLRGPGEGGGKTGGRHTSGWSTASSPSFAEHRTGLKCYRDSPAPIGGNRETLVDKSNPLFEFPSQPSSSREEREAEGGEGQHAAAPAAGNHDVSMALLELITRHEAEAARLKQEVHKERQLRVQTQLALLEREATVQKLRAAPTPPRGSSSVFGSGGTASSRSSVGAESLAGGIGGGAASQVGGRGAPLRDSVCKQLLLHSPASTASLSFGVPPGGYSPLSNARASPLELPGCGGSPRGRGLARATPTLNAHGAEGREGPSQTLSAWLRTALATPKQGVPPLPRGGASAGGCTAAAMAQLRTPTGAAPGQACSDVTAGGLAAAVQAALVAASPCPALVYGSPLHRRIQRLLESERAGGTPLKHASAQADGPDAEGEPTSPSSSTSACSGGQRIAVNEASSALSPSPFRMTLRQRYAARGAAASNGGAQDAATPLPDSRSAEPEPGHTEAAAVISQVCSELQLDPGAAADTDKQQLLMELDALDRMLTESYIAVKRDILANATYAIDEEEPGAEDAMDVGVGTETVRLRCALTDAACQTERDEEEGAAEQPTPCRSHVAVGTAMTPRPLPQWTKVTTATSPAPMPRSDSSVSSSNGEPDVLSPARSDQFKRSPATARAKDAIKLSPCMPCQGQQSQTESCNVTPARRGLFRDAASARAAAAEAAAAASAASGLEGMGPAARRGEEQRCPTAPHNQAAMPPAPAAEAAAAAVIASSMRNAAATLPGVSQRSLFAESTVDDSCLPPGRYSAGSSFPDELEEHLRQSNLSIRTAMPSGAASVPAAQPALVRYTSPVPPGLEMGRAPCRPAASRAAVPEINPLRKAAPGRRNLPTSDAAPDVLFTPGNGAASGRTGTSGRHRSRIHATTNAPRFRLDDDQPEGEEEDENEFSAPDGRQRSLSSISSVSVVTSERGAVCMGDEEGEVRSRPSAPRGAGPRMPPAKPQASRPKQRWSWGLGLLACTRTPDAY
ncbi:hypothetical protein HYH03_000703 [Edaphochlamys debaryana]|uniref:SET domain-containing protein n=1 Tax=Edaphochlamys debaryana TaxID=47281 RepID=A0A835YG03_9CHLO|nr:hypothetical protein HYH03_000703 [Edaphochlamys debaryana]|eukprot:KAG2502217.1 hypothetical protein HYH03_000703 [Edaphochlamys debaryana]